LNVAGDDLARIRDELAKRGVHIAEIQSASKGVQSSATTDPDGNAITLIGNFRILASCCRRLRSAPRAPPALLL
jgi:glyoxylase I family protein